MRLFVLCGPSCSGKTTYRILHLPGYSYVSTDELFLQNTQDLENKPSDFIRSKAYKRIQNSKDDVLVYDSTNATKKRRKELLNAVDTSRCEYIAINMRDNFAMVYQNWKMRGQDIPLIKLVFLYLMYMPARKEEGFSCVCEVHNTKYEATQALQTYLQNPSNELYAQIVAELSDVYALDVLYQERLQISPHDIYTKRLQDNCPHTNSERLRLWYERLFAGLFDSFCEIDSDYTSELTLEVIEKKTYDGFVKEKELLLNIET